MRFNTPNVLTKPILRVLLTCVFTLSLSHAVANTSHKHEGRIHSHALPPSGVKHFHKHTHNGRSHIHPYSDKNGIKHTHNKSARAKAWENAVRHNHGGRPHSHPLPPSGTTHDHRHQHGGRSHIHPLPVSGIKHFHAMNRQAKKLPATVAPKIITDLSIQQQIAAVLRTPLPKKIESKPQITTTEPRPEITPKALLQTNGGQLAQLPKIQQHTINKVLGIHSHNGRTHQYLTPVSGAQHTHKKSVKVKKTVQKTHTIAAKPATLKPKPVRKINTNKERSKLVKKTASKTIATPKRSKLNKTQIAEGNRQFALALRYENGTGVKKNLPQAFNWYLRAAKNGNTKAQFNLASLYENGEGTKQNIPQAIRWYTTAANNGDANAQVNLGNRYAEGRNAPKDIHAAAKWYKRAADQGDMRGRANLNYLIEDYNGVIKR